MTFLNVIFKNCVADDYGKFEMAYFQVPKRSVFADPLRKNTMFYVQENVIREKNHGIRVKAPG